MMTAACRGIGHLGPECLTRCDAKKRTREKSAGKPDPGTQRREPTSTLSCRVLTVRLHVRECVEQRRAGGSHAVEPQLAVVDAVAPGGAHDTRPGWGAPMSGTTHGNSSEGARRSLRRSLRPPGSGVCGVPAPTPGLVRDAARVEPPESSSLRKGHSKCLTRRLRGPYNENTSCAQCCGKCKTQGLLVKCR